LVAGAVGVMQTVKHTAGQGFIGKDMLKGGAAQAQGIAQEHVDMGKVNDAKKEAEEQEEYIKT
jgi:hypothetical protein